MRPASKTRALLICMAFLAATTLPAGCSRGKPSPEGKAAAMAQPARCDRTRVQAALDQFEAFAQRRNDAVLQVESYSFDEPAHYVNNLEHDLVRLDELAAKAAAVEVPACLEKARDFFTSYLEKSRAALDVRRPDQDPSLYYQARETAKAVYEQFKAEVAQQVRIAE